MERETPEPLDIARRGTRLVGFTLTMMAILALLLWLGFWQIHRLHWKEGLLAEIKSRTTAPPVSLQQAIAEAKPGADIEYLRVRLDGRFENGKERYLYAISKEGGNQGWDVITPLKTDSGIVVLVNRGFVPNRLRDPNTRRAGELEGEVSLVGLVRQPVPRGSFTPNNDPRRNRWFWLDPKALAASMFPDGAPEIAPFIVDAEAGNVPGGWPKGGQTDLTLPNNHFGYALTWFSLAAILVAVYVSHMWEVFHAKKPGRASP
jgi:surfeit locus 1 family protein